MENKTVDEWNELSFDDKRKYNGYEGWRRNGELFKDNNAFMSEDKAKLKRRLVKEKEWRDKKKNEN